MVLHLFSFIVLWSTVAGKSGKEGQGCLDKRELDKLFCFCDSLKYFLVSKFCTTAVALEHRATSPCTMAGPGTLLPKPGPACFQFCSVSTWLNASTEQPQTCGCC